MSYLAALDAGNPSLGGKARSLARLAAAGLPTPPGFAITDALFRALCPKVSVPTPFDDVAWAELERLRDHIHTAPWPDGFAEELASRLPSLGVDRFSVRSSFAGEDLAGALAAGVYESHVDVPVHAVEGAVRSVLASAVSPGAAAYALAHGRAPGAAPVAVLIHAFAAGEAEGSAALAPTMAAEPELMVRRGALPEHPRAQLQTALIQLARQFGPVEIEWVLSAQGLVYLQVRPFQPKPVPVEWPGWKQLPPSADRAAWHWDAAHNPLPLSPAQAGLVQFVDEHCRIGIRQRVLDGYLFYTADTRPLPPAIPPTAAAAYCDEVRAALESGMVALGATPTLESALALFASVYERIFGVLQPALKQARRELQSFLSTHAPEHLPLLPALGAGVPSMAEERRRRATAIRQAASAVSKSDPPAATAAYLALFGDEAPIWDVSVPTYAEDPSALRLEGRAAAEEPAAVDWRAADEKVAAALGESDRQTWRRLLPLAREAIALSEADDWIYARAQAVVRRALLGVGRELQRAGRLADASDVFFLPLPLVRKLCRGEAPTADLAALTDLVAGGRTAWQSARKNPPSSAAITADDMAVRGHGTGGHAIGRVALHRSGSFRSCAADTVLLAQTLLPTELPLVAAAAIVTETGGPLDHVAAQARERGIPAVIGAAGATSILDEGDLVLVDGERGLVVRLARA
jgi:phosphohistidine swiveling domain-containing protein